MKVQEIEKRYQVDAPPMTQLQRALLTCDTPLLNEHQVAAYQAQKLKEGLIAQADRERMRGRRRIAVKIAAMLCWGAAVRLLFTLFDRGLDPFWMGLLQCCAILVGACYIVTWPRKERRGPPLAWRLYDIGHSNMAGSLRQILSAEPFDLPRTFRAGKDAPTTTIPLEIWKRCHALHLAGAQCKFLVQQLDEDPFIWACWENEGYCIGVWDETGYVG